MDKLEKENNWDRYGPGEWWSLGWVPFLHGDTRFKNERIKGYKDNGWHSIDTNGVGKGGKPGQIVYCNMAPTRQIKFKSFDAWLEFYMGQLENDFYRVEEEDGEIFGYSTKVYAYYDTENLHKHGDFYKKMNPGYSVQLKMTCGKCKKEIGYDKCECFA